MPKAELSDYSINSELMEDLIPIIESLLFVADEPLSVDKLSNVLEEVEKNEIRTALATLREVLDSRQGGFYLCEVAGGWQLRTRPEYNEWIKRMLQPSPQRLSRAALETLAIVAYKQPVIRADVEYIRGVDSGGMLRQLMERKLVRVLGRKEIPGRPLIYATTKLFLELFDLKDLKDLPSPKEIEELSGTAPADKGNESERQEGEAESATAHQDPHVSFAATSPPVDNDQPDLIMDPPIAPDESQQNDGKNSSFVVKDHSEPPIGIPGTAKEEDQPINTEELDSQTENIHQNDPSPSKNT
jgi:segregation and condensation protein B